MKLVKVKDEFYVRYRQEGTDAELMFNERGRPCVLMVQLHYKNGKHNFVIPLRSNISGKTPKSQYFSLPPNSETKSGNSHGNHYIKIFPIESRYIDSYEIDNDSYKMMIKRIIDKNEDKIIKACQDYLKECEKGNAHPMTPDIDGILKWI